MTSLLLKIFGFPATLMTADTMVLDRWLWLRRRLDRRRVAASLLEVGCGSGAFTIGAARLGYHATGLSWDVRNQTVAAERAQASGATHAAFLIHDARKLDEEPSFKAAYDVVLCLECVEHVLDDKKLLRDLATCLKPGGNLLLTTPNIEYRPLTKDDNGPWSRLEDGGHVRKGYHEATLRALAESAGLDVRAITYCSGILSQKLTALYRVCSKVGQAFAWTVILPLRILPPVLDPLLMRALDWPFYSICLEAQKPTGIVASAAGVRSKVFQI